MQVFSLRNVQCGKCLSLRTSGHFSRFRFLGKVYDVLCNLKFHSLYVIDRNLKNMFAKNETN